MDHPSIYPSFSHLLSAATSMLLPLHPMLILLLLPSVAASTPHRNYTEPPPAYHDGTFTQPGNYVTLTIGRLTRIEWKTGFSKVNLYLVQGEEFARPFLVAGTSLASFTLADG